MTRTPPVIVARHGKSALTRIVRLTSAAIKVALIGNFTDGLGEFTELAGTPTITSGKLTGDGAVRYRDQVATDNYLVTAVVGATASGICRIVTCATASFDRFYAVEIENSSSVSIVKGTGAVATTNYGLFGILLGLLSFFLGGFGASASLPKYGTVSQSFTTNDVLSIWWDEPNSVIRVYKDAGQITSLVVPRWEIPHGDGSRHFGAMVNVNGGGTGMQFSAIGAEDV